MEKLKVITVVGTRPEVIRLSRVIAKLNESDAVEHVLIHTGQNYDYELNQIFFDDMEIPKPNYFLDAAGTSAIETIGQILIKIDPILQKESPDAFLVLGDTNSCLCAIPAKRYKIPIFHMEAGNRCFDQRVPEETNRRIVDHISDVNLPYSDIAREYLLREGIAADRIVKTGSPMYEVLHHHLGKIEESTVLETLNLKQQDYFVISAHREENIESNINFFDLVETLNEIALKYDKPVIISTHPRTRNRIEGLKVDFHPNVRLLKPMAFSDYVSLQKHSLVTLSDSGTISEESSILNFAALNIRQTHERPEAMEEANVMMVGLKKERILQALSILVKQPQSSEREFRLVNDYAMPNVSSKVLRIIVSYVDYVKRTVWGIN